MYMNQKDYVLTGVLLLVSGITDLLDGYIARTFHMMSDLGKILDPVADKATQAVVLLCLVTRFRWLIISFICIVIKELFMTCIGMTVIKMTGEVHGAEWHGKIATLMLDVTIIIHIIFIIFLIFFLLFLLLSLHFLFFYHSIYMEKRIST